MKTYKILAVTKSFASTEAALNIMAVEGWEVVNMTDHMILLARDEDENSDDSEDCEDEEETARLQSGTGILVPQ